MSIDKQITACIEAGASHINTSALALRCITLDGKVDVCDAQRALSAYEQVVFDYLQLSNGILPNEGEKMFLAFRPHGRCYLLSEEVASQYAEYLMVVRAFCIPPKAHCEALAAETRAESGLESRRARMAVYLNRDGFAAATEAIGTAAEHMAPLLFYVGRLCISNFYKICKTGFSWEWELKSALEDVARNGDRSHIEALTLVYVLTLLFASGVYTRPEEMNSSQINFEALEAHFEARFAHYRSILGLSDADLQAFREAHLEERAVLLAGHRASATTQGRFVRDINGINLLKKERFLHQWTLSTATRQLTLKAQSLALIEDAIGGRLPATQLLVDSSWPALTRRALFAEGTHDFPSDLEFVIDALVRKAISATDSDVGMSRGTRSFGAFVQLLESKDVASACAWTQANYFCHAVPSVALERTHPSKILSMLLNAVSTRMRYNSWHYAPSYFDHASIPPMRGWFHAPRMADTAEWSDQHHNGHVHAAVRYSIRSPQPVTIRGTVLSGFVDLRMMRQTGEPYSLADLGTAIAYTEALGLVYQRLMDYVLASGDAFAFTFGDKQWFDTYYARKCAIA